LLWILTYVICIVCVIYGEKEIKVYATKNIFKNKNNLICVWIRKILCSVD
jgi:hypothetical protein